MQIKRNRQFRLNEHGIVRIHDYLYSRQKYPFVFLTVALYMTIILLWGEFFEVSANYFVILPLIVIAISFGFKGGLIAGFLGLPFNLLLFYIIGHMEFAPASWTMAEISGIVVGSILGYLSDFFTMMKKEMRQRQESERALEKSVREKEILLMEINHRVKNNLNLIKSLVQLQANRAPSDISREILLKLRDRIIAIALVQDLLYSHNSLDTLDLNFYLKELLNNILEGFQGEKPVLTIETEDHPIMLEGRKITSLGIIINEVITNIFKHGISRDGTIRLDVILHDTGEAVELSFRDKGPGYPENSRENGLGFKLIRSLILSLNGWIEVKNDKGGQMTLHFPHRVAE